MTFLSFNVLRKSSKVNLVPTCILFILLTAPCKDGEHRCGGGKCVSVAKLCDNVEDCEDASDEDVGNCRKCLNKLFAIHCP